MNKFWSEAKFSKEYIQAGRLYKNLKDAWHEYKFYILKIFPLQ